MFESIHPPFALLIYSLQYLIPISTGKEIIFLDYRSLSDSSIKPLISSYRCITLVSRWEDKLRSLIINFDTVRPNPIYLPNWSAPPFPAFTISNCFRRFSAIRRVDRGLESRGQSNMHQIQRDSALNLLARLEQPSQRFSSPRRIHVSRTNCTEVEQFNEYDRRSFFTVT